MSSTTLLPSNTVSPSAELGPTPSTRNEPEDHTTPFYTNIPSAAAKSWHAVLSLAKSIGTTIVDLPRLIKVNCQYLSRRRWKREMEQQHTQLTLAELVQGKLGGGRESLPLGFGSTSGHPYAPAVRTTAKDVREAAVEGVGLDHDDIFLVTFYLDALQAVIDRIPFGSPLAVTTDWLRDKFIGLCITSASWVLAVLRYLGYSLAFWVVGCVHAGILIVLLAALLNIWSRESYRQSLKKVVVAVTLLCLTKVEILVGPAVNYMLALGFLTAVRVGSIWRRTFVLGCLVFYWKCPDLLSWNTKMFEDWP